MENSYHKKSIAVLISCFNRKDKTMHCIDSILKQRIDGKLTVFLMDNGADGTSNEVRKHFANVIVFSGNSSLYWAGSMRQLWQSLIDSSIHYDLFLLINDDTILLENAIIDLLGDAKKMPINEFILIGSTFDPDNQSFTYGGRLLLNRISSASKKIIPNNKNPQLCDLGNGNIMLVPVNVVKKIGILSKSYTHGLADFDYTLRAKKNGIPSFISSRYIGKCKNDHKKTWLPAKKFSLRKRIQNMYSVKGLAYKEYLSFLKKHFPLYVPYAWLMLWMKTVFPFFWEKLKNIDELDEKSSNKC